MSTRATIAYGPQFHLYHEVLDEDYVYLELEGVQFEASYNRVMVPIPIHIWEVIRHYPGIDLTFANKTDEQLASYVDQQVDERIREYDDAEPNTKKIRSLFGALTYGSADLPREKQIEQGIAYFTELREHQRQIAQAIADLVTLNTKR